MQLLKHVHLVQFFLFDAITLDLDRTSAIIAPNGAGKSALLDALQIVMFGADRNHIRFNAQAGGTHRARSIRDYCLGVFREGDEGRARNTATTYLSMVFEDENGHPLTAGIALGASVDEPDHRVYGWYILPGVALDLADHLEHVGGEEKPLAWRDFSAAIAARCKTSGNVATLSASAERFVDDLLKRLRPPNAFADPVAYRKALRNALNLQKVDDVDLFVRASIAEDRPTDITRFRALLDGFRQIKELIERLVARIDRAREVERAYTDIGRLSVRAASYRALSAVYVEEQLADDIDQANTAVTTANNELTARQRLLKQCAADKAAAMQALNDARDRLQQLPGYGAHQALDRLVGESTSNAQAATRRLGQQAQSVRAAIDSVARLALPGIDTGSIGNALTPWAALHAAVSEAAVDAIALPDPEQLHTQARVSLDALQPVHIALDRSVHQLRTDKESAEQRERTAASNLRRAVGGKAELRADVSRLQEYLSAAGIDAVPICDVTSVRDPAWQPAIEAYLRSHVEALLIPVEHELRAVALYRSLRGQQAVYGVKLALASQSRRTRGNPSQNAVANLIDGSNADAVAYLQMQLGALQRLESDEDAVRQSLGLSVDGLLAKGGSVERLRLPGADELKIGASQSREQRQRLERAKDVAASEAQHAARALDELERTAGPLRALRDVEHVLSALHEAMLDASGALAALRRHRAERADGGGADMIALAEAREASERRLAEIERIAGQAQRELGKAEQLLQNALGEVARLEAQIEIVRASAQEARRDAAADPHRVDRYRQELDDALESLTERIAQCEKRAADARTQRDRKLPEAWAALTAYAALHQVPFELVSDDWSGAAKLLAADLQRMEETELVEHRARAEQAYTTAVSTFRTSVASVLYDNFSRLKAQIQSLNRTLRSSPAFSNDERYEFRYEIVPELKTLHAFVETVGDVGDSDTLFGSAGDVPAMFRDIIDERAGSRATGPSPLDDYRLFFHFEVVIKTGGNVIGTLSRRMRSGSGGEHRAPLYVIAGASLAAAYGKQDGNAGGLGLILLDEFGDKIDAQNARAVTDYLRSLGLQLVVAAPDTAQGTLSGVLDSYIELFRDGNFVQVNRVRVLPEGRALMESDQFALHPALLDAEIARVLSEDPQPHDARAQDA